VLWGGALVVGFSSVMEEKVIAGMSMKETGKATAINHNPWKAVFCYTVIIGNFELLVLILAAALFFHHFALVAAANRTVSFLVA